MQYQYMPFGMSIFFFLKKNENTKHQQGYKLEHSHFVVGNAKWYSHIGKPKIITSRKKEKYCQAHHKKQNANST